MPSLKIEKRSKQRLEKNKGSIPKAPSDKPNAKDQSNFTDPESRIMKTSHGFDQCFNGQGVVNDDMVILGAYSNDKQEFIPAINSIPDEFLEETTVAVADAGCFSEKNIADCKRQNIKTLISTGREKHNSYFTDNF